MKIEQYLEEKGQTMTQFSVDAGVSFFQVYHIARGRTPTLVTALKIEKASGGAVTGRDMISDKLVREIYET